jgi:hypothetical protein
MTRHWSRAIASLGLLGGGLLAACGGDSSDVGGLMPIPDAGRKDSSALGGDDAVDAFAGDDTASSDATVGDAGDDGDDTGDGARNTGDDAATASDAPSEGGLAGDGGDAGASQGGDAGAAADGGDAGAAADGGGSTQSDAGPASTDAGSGATDGGGCNFAGTWGAEITIDVTWAAGGILDIVIAPGSGTIKQWLLSTRTQSGKTVTDTAVVCGIQLPDFQGNPQLVDETYGIRFPNSLFDDGGLTSFAIDGTVSASTPTATYTTTPAAALLGLTLANATTAVWPATITTEIDEDNDTKPGITADVVAPGGGYSYVPLDISVISFPTTVARADELYVAIRQVTSVSAQFSDCDHAAGSVTVPQITDPSNSSKKYAIDSHVIGCRVTGTGTDCSANQTTFVDENQPVFTPSATTFASARLPTGATCATVRSQFQ